VACRARRGIALFAVVSGGRSGPKWNAGREVVWGGKREVGKRVGCPRRRPENFGPVGVYLGGRLWQGVASG
jgi:hypothetical protein